ncbi:MAG TPA: ATP-binding protein, partial [Gemmatimonadaceae bacterium]|nr:ATP-binding protein [Gemmatimonadaceae bacterium]
MSHELRTPLNAVIGLTDAMLEGIGGPLTDRQRGWLDDIAASGKHLLGLINDILDLARIESGRVDLDVQRVQPAEEAEAARRLVAGAAFARGVHVSLELAPRLPMLTTDPRFLRQILLNLLGNAVKFTEPGGHVVCRIIDDTGHVAFQVSDTGVGIAPERLADIFKPFVQLDQGLDRAVEGTGLGLALVARMTERLGGSVQVDSAPGEGSTFTVRIPSLVAPPRDSAEVVITDAEDPSVSRPLRILLAEDNPANVRTFSEYLGDKGMDVRVVGDGVAAVEAATVVRPDVILMDIQMPRMDGLQATRLIRDNPDIRGIPIVALTALAMPGDRERCLEAGATVYLPKPVRLRELVTTIRTLVAGGAS